MLIPEGLGTNKGFSAATETHATEAYSFLANVTKQDQHSPLLASSYGGTIFLDEGNHFADQKLTGNSKGLQPPERLPMASAKEGSGSHLLVDHLISPTLESSSVVAPIKDPLTGITLIPSSKTIHQSDDLIQPALETTENKDNAFSGRRLAGQQAPLDQHIAVIEQPVSAFRRMAAPPATTATIQHVTDNIGLIQGDVASGGRTDDTTPTIRGTLSAALAPGKTLRIFNGRSMLGTATVINGERRWSFTPTLKATAETTYAFTARVADAAGNLGPASLAHSLHLDTKPPATKAFIKNITDNHGPTQGKVAAGGRTDDSTPAISGTLSAALAPSETLRIFNGTSLLGTATAKSGERTWKYTPTLKPTAGTPYLITARVADAAGNLGPAAATRTFTLIRNSPEANILQGLRSHALILAGLNTSLTSNQLLSKKIDLLEKRVDSSNAEKIISDIRSRLDQAILDLEEVPRLSLGIIHDQISRRIGSLGAVNISVDGKLIASSLLAGIDLKPNSEVIFHFSFSQVATITENLAGNRSFRIAGNDIGSEITGKAKGSASVSLRFSLGIDAQGEVFVDEAGELSSKVDLNAGLMAKASIKGLADGKINASGKLKLVASLKIDDGDTTTNERLKLAHTKPAALFAARGISFAGGIDLSQATISGRIANLSAFEIPIVATGSLDFVTAKADISVEQDALFDALVNAAAKGIDAFADQENNIIQFAKDIPLVGSSLPSALAPSVRKALGFDAPKQGTKAYLASKGFIVEKMITPEQFFSGSLSDRDIFLLRYNPSVIDASTSVNASGAFDAGLAKFTLNGTLQATPNLALDLRFGIDLINGPFMVEGGTINARLPFKGSFDGKAEIGSFLSAQAKIEKANFTPTAQLTFSDFDTTTNERFYLLGQNKALDLNTIMANKKAISITGSLALEASLAVADPDKDLKIPLLNKINLDSFTWNAAVQYDLQTGQASYTIKNDASIRALVDIFSGKQTDIINNFLGDLITSNPIPEEIRKVLTGPLPLLDKNLLDIIGAPKAIQLLVRPEQFRGETVEQINDKADQEGLDILDLNLDLLQIDTVLMLLAGQSDINLISLDIKQTLADLKKTFKVLPSTTLFSFYGLANINAGVDIEASISMILDTTVGIDTQGFYVIESGAAAPSGRTVGNMLFSLNPTVSAVLTGSLNLITVLDIIDIAGTISLLGELGIRLDDSSSGVDSDPKVRIPELNDTNLLPTLAVDLGLGLTSTLLPIGDLSLPLIKKGEVEKIVPLYNKSVGSLADVKEDVKAFIEKTKGEGGLKIFALGIVTGSGGLTGAGIHLLGSSPSVTQAFSELATGFKESGHDMLDAAKDLAKVVKTYGLALGETAKFLFNNFSGGIPKVATALLNSGLTDSFGLAKTLWLDLEVGLGEIAKTLKSIANRSLGGIVADLVKGAGLSYWQAAFALWNGSVGLTDSFELAKVLWNQGASLKDIAAALKSDQIANRSLGGIVADLVKGAGLSYWQAAFALWNGSVGLTGSFELAKVLWNQGAPLTEIAAALKSDQIANRSLRGIVADLVTGAGLSYSQAASALWKGGFGINSDTLVITLYKEGAGFDTLVSILQSVVGFKFATAWKTVASLIGL
ncbi:MAG: hypothetical protein VKO39_02990 [Cyanobacteriota bacterium]|nr:hypothetical protein [Cyanobacteriota bacterium]